MGANSIRSNLDMNAIVSEIRLLMAVPDNLNQVFVVVEGEDDIRFWRKRLTKHTELYESFSGKVGVFSIVDNFHSEKVIGICDADYDTRDHEHIFYYDYSSLEMMLIMSNAAFEAICAEYYFGNIQSIQLREKVISDLKRLTASRMLNHENRWGIIFERFSMNNAFGRHTSELSTSILVEALKKNNKDILEHIPNFVDLVNSKADTMNIEELINNTQGHDAIRYFQYLCNLYTSKGCNEAEISHSLRCAYRVEDFRCTGLYQNIYTYQNNLSFSIIEP